MKTEIVQVRLYDVGAEIDLNAVRTVQGLAPRPAPVEARSAAPPSSRFPQPLEVQFKPEAGPQGASIEVRVYSLGVLAVRVRWTVDVATLGDLASQSDTARIGGQPLQEFARQLAGQVRAELQDALRDPYDTRTQEEQYIAYCVLVPPADVPGILAKESNAIAHLISDSTGEELVPSRVAAAHKHTLQYTPGDAVVLGWDHAVILDEPGQYEDILDVMELANLELLEFQTYDAHLDHKLETSFEAIDRLWAPGGIFRSARSALRDISRLRVDFARLTDNLHDTGKIFGDWYTAQLHQRLHDRFHLASWERAVAAKMATLEDMFHLAQEEANHRRSLVLEVMVVLLFILDLALLLRVG